MVSPSGPIPIAFLHPKGFTLIEMLIAMTLLGVMVLLLFSSLRTAAESWNAGENKVIEVNKKAVVYQFFKQHLTSMRPLTMQVSPQNQQNGEMPTPVFFGQEQSMRFAGALPVSSLRRGVQVFLLTSNPEDPSKLMVSLSPFQVTEPPQIDQEILLDHIKSFRFAYYGQINQTSPGGWTNVWSGTEQLPKLIKVTIVLDDESYWPDMIFPIKVNGIMTTGQINNERGSVD